MTISYYFPRTQMGMRMMLKKGESGWWRNSSWKVVGLRNFITFHGTSPYQNQLSSFHTGVFVPSSRPTEKPYLRWEYVYINKTCLPKRINLFPWETFHLRQVRMRNFFTENLFICLWKIVSDALCKISLTFPSQVREVAKTL